VTGTETVTLTASPTVVQGGLYSVLVDGDKATGFTEMSCWHNLTAHSKQHNSSGRAEYVVEHDMGIVNKAKDFVGSARRRNLSGEKR